MDSRNHGTVVGFRDWKGIDMGHEGSTQLLDAEALGTQEHGGVGFGIAGVVMDSAVTSTVFYAEVVRRVITPCRDVQLMAYMCGARWVLRNNKAGGSRRASGFG